MVCFMIVAMLCFAAPASASFLEQLFPPTGLCGLSQYEKQALVQRLQTVARNQVLVPDCGPGLWYVVANFDLGNNDSCPPGWTLITEGSVEGCSRDENLDGGCAVSEFSTAGLEYNTVCGRASGHAVGDIEGFDSGSSLSAEGLIIATPNLQHIWMFAADTNTSSSGPRCPCNNDTTPLNTVALDFVEDNYFCGDTSSDPIKLLWGGDDCSASAVPLCCNFNQDRGGYFLQSLPSLITENMNAAICTNDGTSDGRVFVSSMEIYIQCS